MVLVAMGVTWDADKDRISRAAVTGDGRVGIICARVGDREWEPLYLVTVDAEQRALPHCFALSAAALEALNLLAEAEEGDDE
jgi:hypothetical protein